MKRKIVTPQASAMERPTMLMEDEVRLRMIFRNPEIK